MGPGSLSYYDALGIPRNASSNEIRAAYKKQSLQLHPDKNPYGETLMRYVNEAYEVLSDEVSRATYDRDDIIHRGFRSGSNGRDSANSAAQQQLRKLKQKLSDSEQKRSMLNKKMLALQLEVDATQQSLLRSKSCVTEKNRQNKQLQNKLRHSNQEQQRIQNEVDTINSKYDTLDRENIQSKHRIEVYETKMEKASRALREERRKSSDEMIRAEESAKRQVEEVRRTMSQRSVCYRCNGHATSKEDCTVCMGNGAIQGLWTRCHNCRGAGSFTSINGEEESCTLCNSKGAREGILTMTCFKCSSSDDYGRRRCSSGKNNGGDGDDCNACYKGKIKGFNLRACPFCIGEGRRKDECENCFGRAYVSDFVSTPASSLQRRLASVKYKEQDWSANFLTRNWLSPL